MCLQLVDESDTRTRVGVTAVHETVNERLTLQLVLGCDIAQVEQVLQARVHTTVRGQAHEVNLLTTLFRIREDCLDLRIVQNTAVLAGTVDLHQVLINDTTGTDIEVTYFGVTHLSVRQTDVLTAGLQLRVRIGRQQLVHVGR